MNFRMMFLKIARPAQVAGVEIRFSNQSDPVCDYVILKRKGNKVFISDSSKQPIFLSELFTYLPERIPVGLVLDGAGVLIKKTTLVQEDDTSVIKQIVPGINIEDFSYEKLTVKEGEIYALIRRTTLESAVRHFSETGKRVIHCNLSFLGANILPGLLENSMKIIQNKLWYLQFEDNFLTDYRHRNPQDEEHLYTAGGQEIKSGHLFSFSTAFETLLGASTRVQCAEELKAQKKNYYYDQIFKIAGLGLLGLLFILLLLNSYLFLKWHEELNEQAVLLSKNKVNSDHLDSLRSEFRLKEAFFSDFGILEGGKSAWHADQLASSVVSGISLKVIEIAPPKQEKPKDGTKSFSTNLIYIKGVSKKSTNLNEWIKVLNNLNWVEEVKVLPYREDNEGVGEFEIEIRI
jgi:hypothetical protein